MQLEMCNSATANPQIIVIPVGNTAKKEKAKATLSQNNRIKTQKISKVVFLQ
jgi:hypothetical protein